MEPFRQMGEVLGSLRAQLLFNTELRLNRNQCLLLRDALEHAFDAVSGEIHRFLRFEERHIKWGALDHPLKDLLRVFREADQYVRSCMAATVPESSTGSGSSQGFAMTTKSSDESPAWWARALLMGRSCDCVEMVVHDLMSALPAVFEAVETAGEIAGRDHEEIRRKRLLVAKTYDKDYLDPGMFRMQHVGKRHELASPDFHVRTRNAWEADQREIAEAVAQKKDRYRKEKKNDGDNKSAVAGSRLADVLAGAAAGRLLPTRLLLGTGEYTLRRRLGNGTHLKEVQWLGESFALHHTFGDIAPLAPEIVTLSSLAQHPNVAGCLCAFSDEDRRECYLVTELMARDLGSHVKEMVGPRRRAVPFALHVAVDVMLQVARGMEFLHSRKVYHGNLNPANVLVKPRAAGGAEGYLLVKVAGLAERFLPPLGKAGGGGGGGSARSATHGNNPLIWWAPEVLEEEQQLLLQQQQPSSSSVGGDPLSLTSPKPLSARYTEKADVYSFGMLCFQLLTGKVPFEDSHLQGDKASRNVRMGERPLFPPPTPPKFLTALTKRCWQQDPAQRPGFKVLCRVLRYVKRHLLLHPSSDQKLQAPPPPPLPDLFEIDAALSRRVPGWGGEPAGSASVAGVAQVPFQMFAYRVVERERAGSVNCPSPNWRNASSETSSDGSTSMSGEDPGAIGIFAEDSFPSPSPLPSRSSPPKPAKSSPVAISNRKPVNGKFPSRSNSLRQYHSHSGPLKNGRLTKPPPLMACASMRMHPDGTFLQPVVLSPGRRRTSGHASDSELT